MLRRRRPVARAAVVGGVAYSAGKAGAKASAEPTPTPPTEEPAAPAPAPEAAAPSADDRMNELKQLKDLLDSGVLTQVEFDAQKQKILQSM